MKSSADVLVRGRYVLTSAADGADSTIIDGAVAVSGGRISDVGGYETLKRKYPGAPEKGNGKQLLMPGLIDGHSHGGGVTSIQCGKPFDFLENLLFDWAYLPPVDPEIRTALSAVKHVRNGCTTMHLNYWGEEPNLFENARKCIQGALSTGVRLAYSPGGRNMNRLALGEEEFLKTLPADLREAVRPLVDYDKQAFVEQYLSLFEDLWSRFNTEDTRVLLGPSWVQGSTDDFLRAVRERSESLGGVPVHIHTLQTPIQKAYGMKLYGGSLLTHLDDLGLVGENLVLGHAVFINEGDIRLLADSGASITHHPSCNLAVRNGIAPVYALVQAGVNVALGIDDKAFNDDEDAIQELRVIHKLHRVPGFDLASTPALDARTVMKMGTVNAARVCGFQDEIGELTPGKMADMILVDLGEITGDFGGMDDGSEEALVSSPRSPDIAELFIHRAKGAHVNTVMIGGKVVMEDRKILSLDIRELSREARNQAGRPLSDEQEAFAACLQRVKPYCHSWYRGWEDMGLTPYYVMNSRV
jgi:5-methylthioadenosine/S-adenosylhomocysteine deaminase